LPLRSAKTSPTEAPTIRAEYAKSRGKGVELPIVNGAKDRMLAAENTAAARPLALPFAALNTGRGPEKFRHRNIVVPSVHAPKLVQFKIGIPCVMFMFPASELASSQMNGDTLSTASEDDEFASGDKSVLFSAKGSATKRRSEETVEKKFVLEFTIDPHFAPAKKAEVDSLRA